MAVVCITRLPPHVRRMELVAAVPCRMCVTCAAATMHVVVVELSMHAGACRWWGKLGQVQACIADCSVLA
jgi:hypothetical protein